VRLALFSYVYPPSIGGVERQSHLLARGLVERGYDVRVVAARLENMAAHQTMDGVRIERISIGNGNRWQRMATYLAGQSAAFLKLLPEVDVVHAQQLFYPAAGLAIASLATRPFARRPFVVQNAGSGAFGGVRLMEGLPLGRASLRTIARAASAAISLSDEMTDEMREVGFENIVSIPNGVEIPPPVSDAERAEAKRALGVEGPVALYFGHFNPEKGVDLAIDAFLAHAPKQASLFLVGNGPEEDALRARVREAGREGERIRFVNRTPHLRPYVAAADVFVLPSHSEGVSMALLEAMGASLACIASDCGGNRFVIPDDRYGILVRRDRDTLGESLRRLLESPPLAKALGARARERVRGQFSVDTMVERYDSLYKSLAERQGAIRS
jgi:glycosyltransferase involved in cell wall biosynthesis